ncbi:Formamidopyrimidine-DNA glycosylase [Yarrowia sp. C11]|nr:Formamidopyrimidine-DNA glycosylase [Yarrowia sp. C11]KAG5364753.1 Formamidopyrimidine-DNA glycosylase [Yarrowia sp. E02]
MPELGEVAHAASVFAKFAAGKKVAEAEIQPDKIVFGSETGHEALQKALENRVITGVTRHGKYWWLSLEGDSDNAVLMHFGMTGYISVKGHKTHYIMMENGGDKKARDRLDRIRGDGGVVEEKAANGQSILAANGGEIPTDVSMLEELEEEDRGKQTWPPRFVKMELTLEDGTKLAFYDARRLARVKLFTIATPLDIYKVEPMKKLGPDYSKSADDADTPAELKPLDLEAFKAKIQAKKAPIKSVLLDQSLFSGVGNWVADEILYHSRVHPARLCNLLLESQIDELYKQLVLICQFVVKVEGNTLLFPLNWLMLNRWGKRNKNKKSYTLEGYEVDHVTVGGRTSSFCPELQHNGPPKEKTATKRVKFDGIKTDDEEEPPKELTRTVKEEGENGTEETEEDTQPKPKKRRKKVKVEEDLLPLVDAVEAKDKSILDAQANSRAERAKRRRS